MDASPFGGASKFFKPAGSGTGKLTHNQTGTKKSLIAHSFVVPHRKGDNLTLTIANEALLGNLRMKSSGFSHGSVSLLETVLENLRLGSAKAQGINKRGFQPPNNHCNEFGTSKAAGRQNTLMFLRKTAFWVKSHANPTYIEQKY